MKNKPKRSTPILTKEQRALYGYITANKEKFSPENVLELAIKLYGKEICEK